jgi:plasmid maintenance system antidote protein VapI
MDNGLTMAELAKKIGVHITTVHVWEAGKRSITPIRAVKLEKKLGISRHKLRPDIFGRV